MERVALSQTDFDNLAFCAFRYALGRQTYIVGVIVETLLDYMDRLGDHPRALMETEIREAIEKGRAGDECDVAEWRKVLAALERRKEPAEAQP